MTIRKLAPTLTLFSSLLLASGMAIGQTGMQDDPQGMDRQQGMEQQQQQQGGMDQQRQGGMDQQQQGGMQEQPGMGAGAPSTTSMTRAWNSSPMPTSTLRRSRRTTRNAWRAPRTQTRPGTCNSRPTMRWSKRSRTAA